MSFLHYIRHRSLISLEEINARLVFMRTDRVDHKVNVWEGFTAEQVNAMHIPEYINGICMASHLARRDESRFDLVIQCLVSIFTLFC